MLEGLAAWVLNNYLGKYVEDLNTDQLSIAVLSGEVELENLPLRRDALRHLGAPIEVRAGHIGKVKLQIPVRQLRTAPWVIVIEGLYIVAGPVPCDDPTGDRASAERLAAHDRKLAALDAIDACWRLETDARATPGYYAASYTSWLTYGTGFITDIVENLQLQVVDVHIRYEDATTIAGIAVACGLTIGSLTAQTCDQDWSPCSFSQTSERTDLSYKLVELKDLAVYWDSKPAEVDCEFLVSDKSPGELVVAMAPKCGPRKHLVASVTASARLQRNRSDRPLRGSNEPRFVCDLKLDEVPLSIDELQYDQIIACYRGLELSQQSQMRRTIHPVLNPTEQPREWWIYVTRRHLPEFRTRMSWQSCLTRARDNIRYVQIYSTLLSRPGSALSPDDRTFKDNIEWNQELSELQALREIAMRRTPSVAPPVAPRGLGTLVRWFPQWCGWKNAVGADPIQQEDNRKILEEELLAVLADRALDSTVLRRDAVFGRFNFELTSGALKLCENRVNPDTSVLMLEFQFTGLCLSLESRPRTSSLTVELSVGGICLRDSLTQGSLFPVLVGAPETDRSRVRNTTRPSATTTGESRGVLRKPRRSLQMSSNSLSSDGSPLFQLVYTAGTTSDRRLHVCSRPLDVVYQPAAARWLVEFLCAPHQRAAARRRLRDVGERTRHGLAERWTHVLAGQQASTDSRRAVWDVRLDVSAPQLILVERFCDPDAAIAVLDFGRLRLRSGEEELHLEEDTSMSKVSSLGNDEEEDDEAFMTPCSTPPGSEASGESDPATIDASKRPPATTLTTDTLRQRLYDTYRVDLADIQVLIGRAKDDWRRAHTRGASSLHVLDRFSIALIVERRLVPTTDLTYPSLAVSGTLPRLVAHVNEYKVESARGLLRMLQNTGVPSPLNVDADDNIELLPNVSNDNSEILLNGFNIHNNKQTSQRKNSQQTSSEGARFLVGSFEENNDEKGEKTDAPDNERRTSDDGLKLSPQEAVCRLVAVRFAVEKICVALESKGRCVAELQVSRVTGTATSRPADISATLTVDGLLLVDALQTHGPDFELLAASHPHVGMDSISGSLRDSEPTSPTSPGSPDPTVYNKHEAAPAALSRALSGLESWYSAENGTCVAGEESRDALISLEAVFVAAPDPLHLINVHFNNLDITANQETVVELISFLRRVMPPNTKTPANVLETDEAINVASNTDLIRTELTFDFHRFTILVLRRAVSTEGRSIGKKIATATASGAKLHSTTLEDGSTWIRGSLAGLQIVDITTPAGIHRRIVSAGVDPLCDIDQDQFERKKRDQLFTETQEETALQFSYAQPDMNVQVSSIWYTHSPPFIAELLACWNEFDTYLNARRFQATSPYTVNNKWAGIKCVANLDRLSVVIAHDSNTPDALIASVQKVHCTCIAGRMCQLDANGLDVKAIKVNLDEASKGVRVPKPSVLYERCVESSPVLHETLVRVSAVRQLTSAGADVCNVSVNVPSGLRVTVRREQLAQLLEAVRILTEWRTPVSPEPENVYPETPSNYHVGDISTLEMEAEIRARLYQTPASTPIIEKQFRYHLDIPSIDVEVSLPSSPIALTIASLRLLYEKRPESGEIHGSVRYIRAERTDRPGMLFAVQAERRTLRPNLSRSCPASSGAFIPTPFGSLPNRLSETPVAEEHARVGDSSDDDADAEHHLGDDALQFDCEMFKQRREVSITVTRVEIIACVQPWHDFFDLINLKIPENTPITSSEVQTEWCLKAHNILITMRRMNKDVAKLRGLAVSLRATKAANLRLVRACVRRLILTDLTKHGHCLDIRLEVIATKQAACALDLRFEKPINSFARLRIDLAPFTYIHTARFIAEMSAFITEITPSTQNSQTENNSPLAILIVANSPVVLLPGKPGERLLLGLTAARFLLDGEPGAPTSVSFVDIRMFCFRVHETRSGVASLKVDGKEIRQEGEMLSGRAKLEFTVVRRALSEKTMPKMRLSGRLSAFEATFTEEQSQVVGAVLFWNLNDDTSDIYNGVVETVVEEERAFLVAVRVDVPAVRLHLENWCSVRLDDVRLVSETRAGGERSSGIVCARARVTDARAPTRNACFADVLMACGGSSSATTVAPQLEVHSRVRVGASTRHTVLLNGTRVTLLVDWWQLTVHRLTPEKRSTRGIPPAYELRVNATESEVLFVAAPDCDEIDALVLRSTTLVTYRASSEADTTRSRTLSSSISQCSLLWYPVPMDAIPVAGPTAATIELTADGTLETQLLEITCRLSFADALALHRIANTLLRAFIAGSTPSKCNEANDAQRLAVALGFTVQDCATALRVCQNRADDAALWLTQNARPDLNALAPLVRNVAVNASRMHVCVVDELAGAEVPLAELSLSEVAARFGEDGTNRLDCTVAFDYYNRALNAWEPLVESWRCEIIATPDPPTRWLLNIRSDVVLDVNITDEVVSLTRYLCNRPPMNQVKRAVKRSVFVPYTLRNETGVKLLICAQLIAQDDQPFERPLSPTNWNVVEPGQDAPMPLGDERECRRARVAKSARLLWLKPSGWRHTQPPVAVDRAGVFGRHIEREDVAAEGSTVLVVDVRPVAGSAGRLVCVRGALVIVNRLPYAVDVKLEAERRAVSAMGRAAALAARGGRFAAPLAVSDSAAVYVRPAQPTEAFAYACAVPAERCARCATNRGDARWIWAEVRTFATTKVREREVRLFPGILLVNLLPQEVQYSLGGIDNRVPAGASEAVPQVDPDSMLDLRIRLDNFSCVQPAHIPAAAAADQTHTDDEEEVRLVAVLEDERGRRLQVRVRAERARGARLRLTLTAPYWLVNCTGLPLVFRQQGAGRDAAGQFAEHEVARMRAALPFSLAEPEGAAAVEIRIGGVGASGGSQWCRGVHLRPGEHVRRLAAPDGVLYVLGVEVREVRARAAAVVTVSPRHQLYNGTALELELCRWPPPGEGDVCVVRAPPKCHLPYHHWPAAETRLLCARAPGRSWSGGVGVDVSQPSACRLPLRSLEDGAPLVFLQAEVVPHGAARLVVLSEGAALPPPLRVDNWAAVAVTVAQLGVGRAPLQVSARRRIPYAWDEPTAAKRLAVRAPGGAALVCEPDNLATAGHIQHLAYENFIYIALSADDLVLEATEDSGGRVVVSRRVAGRRSQLWRMTAAGQLQHEGAPAGEPRLLDIGAPAPRPSAHTPIALRRADPRRRSTQTWRFGADGRLCCAHRHMCVQYVDGTAVLAPFSNGAARQHEMMSARRMRPGSGLLAVDVWSDGATRVVRVQDAREPHHQHEHGAPIADARDWSGVHPALWPSVDEIDDAQQQLRVTAHLRAGLGVSVISRGRELLYIRLGDVLTELATGYSLCASVRSLQCDNQLQGASQPVALYVDGTAAGSLPALELRAETRVSPVPRLVLYRHLVLCTSALVLHLDEALLLCLYDMYLHHAVTNSTYHYGDDDDEEEETSELDDDHEPPNATTVATNVASATRYHFGALRLAAGPLRLGAHTATTAQLSPRLRHLKRRLGLALVAFEDAPVQLEAYARHAVLETGTRLLYSVHAHFRDELRWQAATILGSVDFLGAPLGLLGDVRAGVSGMIRERSVGALVAGVAHGLSNSAAKVAETLGDGLGRVALLDEAHEEARRRVLRGADSGASAHLAAGVRGLGLGLLAGATGLFQHAYDGAASDGWQGAVAGLGRGLVGAVAKPVVGVLDLATETARAVRDTSRGAGARAPAPRRSRAPRVPRCELAGRALPAYDSRDATGQQRLLALGRGRELFVAYERLYADLHALISSERVRVLTAEAEASVVLEVPVADVLACRVHEARGRHYIELTVRGAGGGARRPCVRCETAAGARALCRRVAQSKRLHDAAVYTLRTC